GVRQAEADVQVPAAPQVGHRVVGGGVGFLVTQVALQAVGGHGVQQALLVAEDAVDRRGLHAGRRADGAGGDRFAAALGQQLGGGFDDPVPVGLRHTATVTVPVLSVVPVEAGQLPGGVAQAGRGSGGDGLLD